MELEWEVKIIVIEKINSTFKSITWCEQDDHLHLQAVKICIEVCPSVFRRKASPTKSSGFEPASCFPLCRNRRSKMQSGS
jgi:hypothetical protein